MVGFAQEEKVTTYLMIVRSYVRRIPLNILCGPLSLLFFPVAIFPTSFRLVPLLRVTHPSPSPPLSFLSLSPPVVCRTIAMMTILCTLQADPGPPIPNMPVIRAANQTDPDTNIIIA
jgi:hypothetical protein